MKILSMEPVRISLMVIKRNFLSNSNLTACIYSILCSETQLNAVEVADEKILGAPTVVVKKLRKVFGGISTGGKTQVAVNDISFKMYPNQIFALLGRESLFVGDVLVLYFYLV